MLQKRSLVLAHKNFRCNSGADQVLITYTTHTVPCLTLPLSAFSAFIRSAGWRCRCVFCVKECRFHVPISCCFLVWWCFSPPRFVLFSSLVFLMQWRLPSVLFGAAVLLFLYYCFLFSVFLCDVFSVVFSRVCFHFSRFKKIVAETLPRYVSKKLVPEIFEECVQEGCSRTHVQDTGQKISSRNVSKKLFKNVC